MAQDIIAKLTDKEIWEVQFLWFPMSHTPQITHFVQRMERLDPFTPFFSQLKNHPVVEIGPGEHPITEFFQCKEYTAAEGYYPNDGLSVLRKMPDKSAVVFSFGVIDDDVLGASSSYTPPKQKQICTRYINELVDEIRRVAYPFAFIHGADTQKYMGQPDVTHYPKDGGVYLAK